jgi:two-component system sensor histidine kinase YesM
MVVTAGSGPQRGERRPGYFWPAAAAHYRLVTESGTWIGRQYFDGTWYLCAYVPVAGADGVYVRVAVPQVQMGILGRDLIDIELGDGGYVYIIDTSGNVVFDPDPQRQGENLSVEPWAREIAFGRSGSIEYQTDRLYLAAYEFIDSMNWVVVVATTADEAFYEIDTLTRVFLALFSMALLLAMMISLLLGRQISRPVAEVARRFQEIADGETATPEMIAPPRGSAEVRALVRDFNRYVHRTMELNELERREVALELRQEQMKALQAQINPHFLYNTLETIRFLIEMRDPRAVGTVQTLSDLFRVSLANADDFTTLNAELEHARLYFDIQAVRYASMLALTISVDDALRDTPTLSFLLQPIVENAIVHGIVPSQRPGTVIVSADADGDDLAVSISDTGRGLDGEALEAVRAELARRTDGTEGIGLRNVHERLRLTFGTGYGVSISSRAGIGTTVELRMPRNGYRRRISDR